MARARVGFHATDPETGRSIFYGVGDHVPYKVAKNVQAENLDGDVDADATADETITLTRGDLDDLVAAKLDELGRDAVYTQADLDDAVSKAIADAADGEKSDDADPETRDALVDLLVAYGEWLDGEGVIASDEADARSHEELAKDYLDGKDDEEAPPATQFDPAKNTAKQVKDYLAGLDPENEADVVEYTRVATLEKNGENRSTAFPNGGS